MEDKFDNHVDKIVETIQAIPLDKVSILTGGNASGKSIIRQQLSHRTKAEGSKTQAISMQLRTGSRPEFGGLSAAGRDNEWTATSMNTWHLIKGLFHNATNNAFLVVDEPEIGLSEELTIGMALALNKFIQKLKDENRFKGVMVITHSRLLIQHLTHDEFFNLNDLTEEQYLTRTPVAIDLDEVEEWSEGLFKAIGNRQKS